MTNPTAPELIARSNRLGADPRNTNYAGGNTSAKGTEIDPVTGETVELLWVKGSGGDLGTLTEAGLAVLRLDRLRALVDVYPGVDREDEMVAAFDYSLHGKGGAAPSIDTAMHGLGRRRPRRPPAPGFRHRDRDRRRRRGADRHDLRRPGGLGALAPPRLPARPGHRRDQGRQPAGDRLHPRRPRHHRLGRHQRGVRGATRCGSSTRPPPTSPSTPAPSRSARRWPATARCPRPSAGPRPPLSRPRSCAAWSSTDSAKVGHFTDAAVVLDFLSRAEHPRLAALGTSCPDHFLRTKVKPMVLDLPADAIGRGLDRPAAGAARGLPRGLPGLLRPQRDRRTPRPSAAPTR